MVLLQGEVVFEAAYGYLDPEMRQRPATLDACFDLASLTKLFTFTFFMYLVEAGRVRLDDPVASVIPEFGVVRLVGDAEEPITKTPLPADVRWAGQRVDAGRITFRHLLTHTSGLAAWRSVYLVAGNGTVADRWQRALAAICGWDFYYPTGAAVVYSDLGFMLLGEAVSRLYGLPLEVCVGRELAEPLGLAQTGYRPVAGVSYDVGRGTEGILSAGGYAPTEICTIRHYRLIGEVDDENCAGLGGIAGHAGLFASAPDVARLCEMYCEGKPRLLGPATIAEMTREQASDGESRRGLGWALAMSGASCGPDFGPDAFGHTGFTGSSAWIDPGRRLVVVLLTNRVYYGRQATGIMQFRPALHSAVIRALEGTS
jgi:serine-type D-Ala-D-Ala carboxypeptidase